MGQRIEGRAAIEKRIRTSLENLVFALGEVAGADRSSLVVVDGERDEWIRMGAAQSRPRFNREVDAVSGIPTQSLLCIPVRGPSGRVSAVLELRKPIDRPGFSAEDQREVSAYAPELAALLGACRSLA